MNRDEFKREAESVTDKVLTWVVSLPAPMSAAVVLAWSAGWFILGALLA